MHTLEVVVSHTTTIIGSIIRKITDSYWNHCSVTLDGDFHKLYSFSRRYKRFWFTGCFTSEDINDLGDIRIYQIKLPDIEYYNIRDFIQEFKKSLRVYDYLGCLLIMFNKEGKAKNSYLCSTFTALILQQALPNVLSKSPRLYKPMDIFNLLEGLVSKNIAYEIVFDQQKELK